MESFKHRVTESFKHHVSVRIDTLLLATLLSNPNRNSESSRNVVIPSVQIQNNHEIQLKPFPCCGVPELWRSPRSSTTKSICVKCMQSDTDLPQHAFNQSSNVSSWSNSTNVAFPTWQNCHFHKLEPFLISSLIKRRFNHNVGVAVCLIRPAPRGTGMVRLAVTSSLILRLRLSTPSPILSLWLRLHVAAAFNLGKPRYLSPEQHACDVDIRKILNAVCRVVCGTTIFPDECAIASMILVSTSCFFFFLLDTYYLRQDLPFEAPSQELLHERTGQEASTREWSCRIDDRKLREFRTNPLVVLETDSPCARAMTSTFVFFFLVTTQIELKAQIRFLPKNRLRSVPSFCALLTPSLRTFRHHEKRKSTVFQLFRRTRDVFYFVVFPSSV